MTENSIDKKGYQLVQFLWELEVSKYYLRSSLYDLSDTDGFSFSGANWRKDSSNEEAGSWDDGLLL